ncbi:MAG: citryl-CoA lyase [Gammaproteobacteria bacterium]|nr:citryl-CoA lyase [Gammaproteobacteria bacterium]
MSTEPATEKVTTKIWYETASADNPFVASDCYCYGYNVYDDVLLQANWIEYLYLLFLGEQADRHQTIVLQQLAIALANPGPRDASVRAAMNAGVGGSTTASCLIAAIAVNAGQFGGGREVYSLVECIQAMDMDLSQWLAYARKERIADIDCLWPETNHLAGFNPYQKTCSEIWLKLLTHVASDTNMPFCAWLVTHYAAFENITKCAMAKSFICAAIFKDLGFNSEQAEALYLLLSMPGAVVHALEQKVSGWRHYPFFANGLDLAQSTLNAESSEPVEVCL